MYLLLPEDLGAAFAEIKKVRPGRGNWVGNGSAEVLKKILANKYRLGIT